MQPNNHNQNLRKTTGNRVTEEDYASSSHFEPKKRKIWTLVITKNWNFVERNHNSHDPNSQGVRACPPNDDHQNRVKNRLHRWVFLILIWLMERRKSGRKVGVNESHVGTQLSNALFRVNHLFVHYQVRLTSFLSFLPTLASAPPEDKKRAFLSINANF